MAAAKKISWGDGQPGLVEAGPTLPTKDLATKDLGPTGLPDQTGFWGDGRPGLAEVGPTLRNGGSGNSIWGDGLPRLHEAETAAAVSARLEERGSATIPGALSLSGLAELNDQLSPWFEKALAGRGPFLGRHTRRFSALFARAPRTIDLAINPTILAAVHSVLKDEEIQINLTQAIAIDPGEPAQALHRDEGMFPATLPFEVMVNVLWTLDEFTEANGATRIVPGSHLWPKDRRGLDSEGVAMTAPAGSAIIWLGSAIHGGGANRTDETRRGLIISYSLGWLAPAEKLLLSIPPEVARGFPRRLQRMIGYQVHRPNLGWIEGRDPIEWLDGRLGDMAAADDHLPPDIRSRVERLLAAREHSAADQASKSGPAA
jgi:ectoine hydroxylase-related dioxygenase (phytanoyl-CoA dioxygenase family)